MQNHATYETSVRLKEAGFPQPEPEAGQFWYNTMFKQDIGVVVGDALYFVNGTGFTIPSEHSKNYMVFAPTAADILRELKRLVGEHIEVQMQTLESEFVVMLFEELPFGNFDTILEKNDNSAEAAAQAFLNLKAKQ